MHSTFVSRTFGFFFFAMTNLCEGATEAATIQLCISCVGWGYIDTLCGTNANGRGCWLVMLADALTGFYI